MGSRSMLRMGKVNDLSFSFIARGS